LSDVVRSSMLLLFRSKESLLLSFNSSQPLLHCTLLFLSDVLRQIMVHAHSASRARRKLPSTHHSTALGVAGRLAPRSGLYVWRLTILSLMYTPRPPRPEGHARRKAGPAGPIPVLDFVAF
jgi:hypothetical protein